MELFLREKWESFWMKTLIGYQHIIFHLANAAHFFILTITKSWTSVNANKLTKWMGTSNKVASKYQLLTNVLNDQSRKCWESTWRKGVMWNFSVLCIHIFMCTKLCVCQTNDKEIKKKNNLCFLNQYSSTTCFFFSVYPRRALID